MGAGITINYIDQTPLLNVLCWKVSLARHKVTNEPVSLWEIDYDIVQSIGNRNEREIFLTETLNSIMMMRRICHPGVLKILEVSENIKALNFAAEPISCCLMNDFDLTYNDVSILSYQLCNVMSFLNDSARIVMFGLSRESIFLTKSMDS